MTSSYFRIFYCAFLPCFGSLVEFDSIGHLSITCSMLGTTQTIASSISQLPVCGLYCSELTSCLAWSWVDEMCYICNLDGSSSWRINPDAIGGVNAQYLVKDLRELRG